jgi:hypothetical protein
MGGTDKVKAGAGGSKSSTSDAKAGSGGSDKGSAGGDAANSSSGGTGGSAKASGGTGGNKASGGAGGTGKASGAGGNKASAGKGGSGGSSGSTETAPLLSAACKACWRTDDSCKDLPDCDSFGKAKAMAGPKAGEPKKALCEELLRCVGKTHCDLPKAAPLDPEMFESTQPAGCLCTGDDATCGGASPPSNGPCVMEAFAAAETKVFMEALPAITNTENAAGVAFGSTACLSITCAKSCGLCDAKDPKCVDTNPKAAGAGVDMSMADGGV